MCLGTMVCCVHLDFCCLRRAVSHVLPYVVQYATAPDVTEKRKNVQLLEEVEPRNISSVKTCTPSPSCVRNLMACSYVLAQAPREY